MGKMVNLDFYKNKKVFVTGHTGFKGSWLCRILINSGAEVFGYSLAPITNPNLFDILGLDKDMTSYIGNINDLNNLQEKIKLSQAEIVFHLAAQPLVIQSYKDPVETYQTNVMGTVNILEAVRNLPSVKSFVNITTDKVYENKEWAWGYRENERLCGFDPYSNSKSCSELVTYSYKNSFFNSESCPAISTARSGNVIGGGDFSDNRIVPDCYRDSVVGKEIQVRNPFSTRPYQHVLDCLSGYLLLAQLQYDKTYEGNYNFGPNDTDCVTTGNLVDKFCKFWGESSSWVDVHKDDCVHEANFLKLDCSKAKSVLAWTPTWSIDKALEKTVEWYKAFSKGEDIVKVTDCQIKEFFYESR